MHVFTLPPGDWAAGTPADPLVKKALWDAAKAIIIASNGGLGTRDLALQVTQEEAAAIVGSREFLAYMQASCWPVSEGGHLLCSCDLPSHLYGIRILPPV